MKIDFLSTRGFRNLKGVENFKPQEHLNIFVGSNGQGKTNLLEAIYIASRGKSFRAGQKKDFICFLEENFSSCSLQLKVSKEGFNHDLKISWDQNSTQILLDDKKTSSTKLAQVLPTILFSPESLLAIKQGPEKRRELIDDIISSFPLNQHVLAQFKKALKNRNKFLKDCKEKGSVEEGVFKSLDVLFMNFSSKMALARIDFLYKLSPYIKKTLKVLFKEDLDFSFEYLISDREVKKWSATDILNLHQTRAKELRDKEILLGKSLVGAQKHDIKFFLNKKDSRYFSSQGQQRALILAVKMAEVMYKYELGERPILLLDDVLSELDSEKQRLLTEFLKAFKTQTFITTTDVVEGSEISESPYYLIKEGEIQYHSKEL